MATKLELHATSTGPARYTGMPPESTEPVAIASEEELLQCRQQCQGKSKADERVQHAEATRQEGKGPAKKGFVDKARAATLLAGAKAAASAARARRTVAGRLHKKASEAEENWFEGCFPELRGSETVRKMYRCTYVDGHQQEHLGRLAVTGKGVHFADGTTAAKLTVKESAPFALVASLYITQAHPKTLEVYTQDRRAYRFKNVKSDERPNACVDETLLEAHHWMTHYVKEMYDNESQLPAKANCSS
ncbi:hypothetical protein DIPPA_20077 [Diplonema papillatum]|nr:hypothetical protein DIPPA_20077 [Diplonema papillatum]|eukprot:gene10348-15935_t